MQIVQRWFSYAHVDTTYHQNGWRRTSKCYYWCTPSSRIFPCSSIHWLRPSPVSARLGSTTSDLTRGPRLASLSRVSLPASLQHGFGSLLRMRLRQPSDASKSPIHKFIFYMLFSSSTSHWRFEDYRGASSRDQFRENKCDLLVRILHDP